MLCHDDNCSWLGLRADFYNYFPILAPLDTVILILILVLNKTLTPTVTDLILDGLQDVAQATMEPVELCDEW